MVEKGDAHVEYVGDHVEHDEHPIEDDDSC